MIQFNLLPDVKLEYIKAQRTERLVITGSIILGSAALAIFVLLFLTVNVFQKKNMNDLNKDIASNSAELKKTDNIDKVLTVQNQLSALKTLHDSKPVDSRIFTYMSQLTPAQASIGKLDIDHELKTMKISGSATSLDAVNIFTDTLKFTKFATKADPKNQKPAFSQVVLTTFGRDEKGATYAIDLVFDETIFSNDDEVALVIPNQVTTRSEVEKPTQLFQQSTNGTDQ